MFQRTVAVVVVNQKQMMVMAVEAWTVKEKAEKS